MKKTLALICALVLICSIAATESKNLSLILGKFNNSKKFFASYLKIVLIIFVISSCDFSGKHIVKCFLAFFRSIDYNNKI